jgi:hypothetical protein
MLPDEPNDEEKLEELPEDGQTPFSPADPEVDDELHDEEEPIHEHLDDTHPSTDTDVQREDIYENGIPDAAEAREPNEGNTVLDRRDEEPADPDLVV